MSEQIAILDRLLKLGSPAGGWGYQPGLPAQLEPTCLATLALAGKPDRYKAWVESGVRALDSHAQPDGSYRLTQGRKEAEWPTALVLFTRTALEHGPDKLDPVADHLLAAEGLVVRNDPEFDTKMDIDLQLLGWPWAEKNFSWVEPTAWACLALRAVGRGSHIRVQEGMRLLIDRAFDAGGANYGNKSILGKTTEPIPGPTAIALLALQGVSGEPRVSATVAYLREHALRTGDLDHLAWSKLALALHADEPGVRDALPAIDAKIREVLPLEASAEVGLAAGAMRVALAALALDTEQRHPFRIAEPPVVAAESIVGKSRLAEEEKPVDPAAPAGSLGERIVSRIRGFFLRGLGNLRALPATSAVHIAKADSYDGPLAEILATQYAHFRDTVPVAGKRVVLKPNLVEYHREKVINTDPRFVAAVIDMLRKEGAAEILVAEGPGHWRNVTFLVNESGLGDVLRSRGVRFVDINHDEPVKLTNLGRTTGLDHLYMSSTVVGADVFVSLPKLKMHHWAGATLSLKNLFGTLPGCCYGWPKNELHWRGIPQSIVDIALTHTPHLAIVDGIVGMEGDGPLNGSARFVGALVMGADLVAVDATCCRLMGLPPERVPTLVLAAEKRLGLLERDKIPMLGETIESLAQPFVLPPTAAKVLFAEAKKAEEAVTR